MKRTVSILGALLVSSAPCFSANVPWFESNTPLTQAHQNLLNGNLPAMFSSLVEVWQLEKNENLTPHLNELFLMSLEADCGKGLDTKALPLWLKSVTVRRSDIQSPGRDAYRAVVEVNSTKELVDVSLTRWIVKSLSSDDSLISQPLNDEEGQVKYIKRYNLNSRMPMGLYRIDVTAADQTSWSSWLVIGEEKAKQTVRWATKDQWQVEKKALLNPTCPLPKLNVAVYDYVDGRYNQVWSHNYETEYPTSLDTTAIPPDRYVLAVSMTHQRWQGPIIVEESQIISKTYDVSADE
ncbi:DUF2861 family protein [Vibrio olivae]|uniref:DUF2861 family protein n=1 Tax=Vibrio olivae TaxID=1243002 RepID=A0ABV5HRD4_9VIBR